MRETDPTLRRIERTAVAWCAVAAAVALVGRGGRVDVAGGVLGGGVLVGMSYWATKRAVDRLAAVRAEAAGDGGRGATAGGGRRWARAARAAAWLVGRYALLGLAAYVMMTRLRLHPAGLLLGASSVVAAAAIEAIRASRP